MDKTREDVGVELHKTRSQLSRFDEQIATISEELGVTQSDTQRAQQETESYTLVNRQLQKAVSDLSGQVTSLRGHIDLAMERAARARAHITAEKTEAHVRVGGATALSSVYGAAMAETFAAVEREHSSGIITDLVTAQAKLHASAADAEFSLCEEIRDRLRTTNAVLARAKTERSRIVDDWHRALASNTLAQQQLEAAQVHAESSRAESLSLDSAASESHLARLDCEARLKSLDRELEKEEREALRATSELRDEKLTLSGLEVSSTSLD